MKANVITHHGRASEVFRIIDLPIPKIGDKEVLIKVESTSVNPLDCKIRAQTTASGRNFPLILGFDVCGTIVECGSGVTNLIIGDRVIASPNVYKAGANAEYVAVEANTCAVIEKTAPETLAALPLTGITAYEAIVERLKIKTDDTILIHAGAGGVGHIAIQIAKSIGANVINTAGREESIHFCTKELHADCINYNTENLFDSIKERTNGMMLSHILDTVGGNTFIDSLDCLRPDGHICTILPVGLEPSKGYHNLLKNITISYEFMGVPTVYGYNQGKQSVILEKLLKMIKENTLFLKISSLFSFGELYKAHEQVESNRTIGKVVVKF